MKPFSYHNHTTFCDGKHTVEEMVQYAIKNGCDVIGFSGHSREDENDGYSMPMQSLNDYKAEVRRVGEKYKDQIKVYLGIEQEYVTSPEPFAEGFDYKIGSVHNVLTKDGVKYQIDHSEARFLEGVREGFGGDVYAYCENYFEYLANVHDRTGCQIVGHLDLVTKFNEGDVHFDENNERYVAAAERAIKKLCAQGMIFEINTGAISRGHRTVPYPSKRFLEAIRREGGRITYSSDCHDGNYIACAFEESVALAKECGFEGFMKLTDNGFVFEKFDDEE